MLSVRFKRLSPSKDDRALRGEAAALIWGDGIWLTRPRSSRGFKAPNPVVSGRGFWSRTAAGGAARWAGAADSPPPRCRGSALLTTAVAPFVCIVGGLGRPRGGRGCSERFGEEPGEAKPRCCPMPQRCGSGEVPGPCPIGWN